MHIFKKNIHSLFLISCAFLYLCIPHFLCAQDNAQSSLSDSLAGTIQPQLRFMRVFGAQDETAPPVVLCSRPGLDSKVNVSYAYKFITIQFDVQSKIPPQMFVIFKHCNADWSEDNNSFLNDPALLRTSSIDWMMAPPASIWYNYRGTLQVPNEQVKFNYAGNWKAECYLFDDPDKPFAIAKFFVVDPKAETILRVFGDFYSPQESIFTSGAYTLEATTRTINSMPDGQLNTAVFYRMNRYQEPFIVSENSSYEEFSARRYSYEMPTMISGFGSIGRRFRIEKIPAENEYRVLDLTDFSLYPRTNSPLRMWRPDLWRNGSFSELSDGGAMITRYLSSGDMDYVNIEFLLNPQNRLAKHEVFISGSFNNFQPDASWMMYYDENVQLYRLRQWIPRGRHSYQYSTGTIHADTRLAEQLTTEEFEGNTARAAHNFIVLIYYREFGFGGYDSIIGIGGGNVNGSW